MKQETLSVLFLIRKARVCKTGEIPIQMRITVNGRFIEFNTQRRILPEYWNQRKERATGKCPTSTEINYYLDSRKSRIYEIHKELVCAEFPVDPIVIKEKLQSKHDDCKMFCQVFEEHNLQMEKLLDMIYSG